MGDCDEATERRRGQELVLSGGPAGDERSGYTFERYPETPARLPPPLIVPRQNLNLLLLSITLCAPFNIEKYEIGSKSAPSKQKRKNLKTVKLPKIFVCRKLILEPLNPRICQFPNTPSFFCSFAPSSSICGSQGSCFPLFVVYKPQLLFFLPWAICAAGSLGTITCTQPCTSMPAVAGLGNAGKAAGHDGTPTEVYIAALADASALKLLREKAEQQILEVDDLVRGQMAQAGMRCYPPTDISLPLTAKPTIWLQATRTARLMSFYVTFRQGRLS